MWPSKKPRQTNKQTKTHQEINHIQVPSTHYNPINGDGMRLFTLSQTQKKFHKHLNHVAI